jgi:hypothetical protein
MTYNDECPKHETPEKKAYTFSRYADAEVRTFQGCKCAVCFVFTGFADEPTYHKSYNQAAGAARLAVARANTW